MSITPDRDRLFAACDELNAALLRAEQVFQEHYTSVSVEVSLPCGATLGYAKHGDKWRLVIADGQTLPITSASRKCRVEAAHKLKDLFVALQDATVETTTNVLAATDVVNRFTRGET